MLSKNRDSTGFWESLLITNASLTNWRVSCVANLSGSGHSCAMTEMAHCLKLSSEERRARPVVATDHIPDILTFLMISGRETHELPDLLMDIPMRRIVMLSEFL